MVVWVTVGLALLAVLLIGPVPKLLARAWWPQRAPRAGVVLWQAIGVTAALSTIGAGLGAAVAPLAATLPHGVHTLLAQLLAARLPSGLRWPHYLALVWALGLVGFLSWRCGQAVADTLDKRRRHRDVVDVVAEPDTELGPDVDVLNHPVPTAYCLPERPSRIVLSLGAVDLLLKSELYAVLAHERAHAAARHDLAVLPFTALAHALPRLSTVRLAREAVCLLVEMLADDSARRRHDSHALARALLQLAVHTNTTPPGAVAAAETAVLTRVRRLLAPAPPMPGWRRFLVYGLATLLLFVPTAVLLSPLVSGLP